MEDVPASDFSARTTSPRGLGGRQGMVDQHDLRAHVFRAGHRLRPLAHRHHLGVLGGKGDLDGEADRFAIVDGEDFSHLNSRPVRQKRL